MSCEEFRELVLKLALGFVFLFVFGFMVLYYAIRRLICMTTDMCSGFRPEIGGIDMLAGIFVGAVLLLSVLGYISSRGEG
jgi:hypothetical protein